MTVGSCAAAFIKRISPSKLLYGVNMNRSLLRAIAEKYHPERPEGRDAVYVGNFRAGRFTGKSFRSARPRGASISYTSSGTRESAPLLRGHIAKRHRIQRFKSARQPFCQGFGRDDCADQIIGIIAFEVKISVVRRIITAYTVSPGRGTGCVFSGYPRGI